MRIRRAFLALAASVALASCGGGGGGGGGGANGAPTLTSASTATVAENAAGAFYTATATDPDGDRLTWSVSGGADAAHFSIGAQTGALSFARMPDFELAGDANADNVYEVTIAVSDGRASASLNLRVTVTDVPGVVVVRRIATGLSQPIFLTGAPASPLVFVMERTGIVRVLNPSTGALFASPFLNVSGAISTTGEQGLLGFALAPDFATSGHVYIHMNNSAGDTEIRRYQGVASNLAAGVDPSSANIILTADQPAANNHKGGWIGFGPDNFLYIGLGDGGGTGDPFANAQNPNTLLGAVLRVDPSGDAFPGDANRDYRIPASNPFAGGGGAPEIWLWGLRNPYRASFDRDTGNLFIGDVGQGAVEEIDLARPGDGGANYGWNIYEGTQPYPPGSPAASTVGLTFPIAQYPHGAGPLQGRSVTGGYVYRGSIAALRGHYFFADFINARIWSIWTGAVSQGNTLSNTQFLDRTAAFAPNQGAINNPASFGEDARGNLYILDFDGEVFVVTEDDEP